MQYCRNTLWGVILRFDCILKGVYILRFDCILKAVILRFDCILKDVILRFDCILNDVIILFRFDCINPEYINNQVFMLCLHIYIKSRTCVNHGLA